MKKRSGIIAIILTFILLLPGCGLNTVFYEFGLADYSDWIAVEINNTGKIKIPNNWEKKEYNNLFYFCDKDDNNKIFMFQSKSNVGVMSDHEYEKGGRENNIVSAEFRALSEISYKVLYADSIYADTLVELDGEEVEMRCIKMYYTTLYVFDNDVEDDTLYKIAYSLEENENLEFIGYY